MIFQLVTILDLLFFASILVFNYFILFCKFKIRIKVIKFLFGLFVFTLFFAIFPYLSFRFEHFIVKKYWNGVESPNFYYLIIKWPMYWFLGFIQLILLIFVRRKSNFRY